MMWKLLFLLMATVVAAEDEEVEPNPDCKSVLYDECERNEEPLDYFPGTEEELEEACKYVLKYFNCSSKLLDQCDEADKNTAQFMQLHREINSNAIRVCDRDSLLFSALADSLPCLKQNPGVMFYCHVIQKKGLDSFSYALSGNGITHVEGDDDDTNRECLTGLFTTSCLPASVGNVCGDIARDVLIDIFQGFDLPYASCRPGVKGDLPAIVRLLQLELKKYEDIENALKKKK